MNSEFCPPLPSLGHHTQLRDLNFCPPLSLRIKPHDKTQQVNPVLENQKNKNHTPIKHKVEVISNRESYYGDITGVFEVLKGLGEAKRTHWQPGGSDGILLQCANGTLFFHKATFIPLPWRDRGVVRAKCLPLPRDKKIYLLCLSKGELATQPLESQEGAAGLLGKR